MDKNTLRITTVLKDYGSLHNKPLPNQDAIDDAAFFTSQLPEKCMPLQFSIGENGTIKLTLKADNPNTLLIDFEGNGKCYVYAESDTGMEYYADVLGVATPLPIPLKDILTRREHIPCTETVKNFTPITPNI